MVFSSFVFLFLFLPIISLLYLLMPLRFRNLVLFLASLLFYGWGEPKYVLIMLFLQMTIKTRNRLIIFFSIFSLILLLGMSSLFVISLISNKFVPATEHTYTLFQNFFLTKFNFLTVVISIFVFLMYVSVSFLYINFEFEKTQSTEIIYFSLFLIGCLTESFRLFIPCLN